MLCRSCKTVLSEGVTSCPVCAIPIQIEGFQSPYELDNEVLPFVDYSQSKVVPIAAPIQMSHTESAPKRPYASQQTILAVPQSVVRQQPQIHQDLSAVAAALLVVLARYRGEIEQAIAYLQEAEKFADDTELPGDLWSIKAASRAFAQAVVIVRKLSDYLESENQRVIFLVSPIVRRILVSSSS